MTLEDIKFEQACVLYNIGSLHSVLGAMDTRQSADVSDNLCGHMVDIYNCDAPGNFGGLQRKMIV